jgi:ferredoxin-NADP reductase
MTSHPFQAPGAPEAPRSSPAVHDQAPLVVDTRVQAADGVVSLVLRRPDDGPLPVWAPGAHIDLVLDNGLVRQYSLCGNPADRAVWQIAVLREPDGRGGSRYVHDRLAEGSTVRVRGPRNNFPLRAAEHHLFVAGGVGITAILPMVDAAEAAGADWHLLYGGRTRGSMAFLDRLARYGDRVWIRPQDTYGLLDLASFIGSPREGTLVHACGPEPLLRAAQEQCADWPSGTLGIERFAPVRPPDEAALADAFDVVLSRSKRTLSVPADRSVLEVLEEAGVPVRFACREGTCGTCETGVLDGTPDHRDSLLDEDERAACDIMLICVSRSCGPRLVLDL